MIKTQNSKQNISRLIKNIANRITDNIHAEKIIMFGSYAYGRPNIDSDIDLLIIMETKLRPIKRSIFISKLFYPRALAMDIIVRTPNEVKERIKIGDDFIKDIISKGKVLYERKTTDFIQKRI